jgi:hypothetical protein
VASYSGHTDLSATIFSPISDLIVPNADTVLLAMSPKIVYTGEVLDPWFQANRTSNKDLVGSEIDFLNPRIPYGINAGYLPNHLLSVLGCVEQYEFCNTTHCSGLGGLYANDTSDYLNLSLNDNQKAVFNLIWRAAWGIVVQNAPLFLGDQVLLAQQRVWIDSQAISAALPPDQWKAEVLNFMGVMMAALQRRVVDFASAPSISIPTSNGMVSSQSFVPQPETEAEKQLCGIIRIRNSAYYNFQRGWTAWCLCCRTVNYNFRSSVSSRCGVSVAAKKKA